ncbi:hypothetical protein GIB67_022239 [Kingdonia uniflora]|uniref:Anaphase-promoting complex subunit 5 n=1 Tax=Kingdonia uniflora TaxID=39325 RepID=A0A7J7M6X6_9MAGN|nr:hypothetical protein GIB67_022239 [Kingdonia uniflora]
MAGNMKEIGAFAITPHKVSVCILLQAFVAPTEGSVPYPFSSASEHNRFGLFLISLTKSCDNILEPKLDELMNYTREVTGILSDMISEQLTRGLSSMASPDDLFALFSSLRGTLGPPDMSAMVDNQILLDSYSHLGMYLRRCLLAFNLLKFEGVCHLLTNIGTYCKESFCPTDEFHEDGSSIDLDETFEFEDIDSLRLGENVNEINTSRTRSNKSSMFHIHAPSTLLGLLEVGRQFAWTTRVEEFRDPKGDGCGYVRQVVMEVWKESLLEVIKDIQVSPGIKCNEDSGQGNEMVSFPNDASRANDHDGGMFLRTNWQVQGYLIEQADLIEKHASLFPMNDFESVLKQLQRLAPELHRVHYLRYLNNLYHEDYPFALENLYCYFDYR